MHLANDLQPGLIPQIEAAAEEIAGWRRYLHSIPELGFEEKLTSAFVREKLAEWGIPHETVAGTGVVATLRKGTSSRAIGIRADMDALPMQEDSGVEWQSATPGKMHACGHDGHTTTLLAAARHLAQHGDFDGTVHFIFQPGEEGYAGARVMIEQGLFTKFPCDQVFGAHNEPYLEVGKIAAVKGPVMAASDTIRITIKGRSGHAARPHQTIDPIIVGANIAMSLQTLVTRQTDSLDSAVISITQFHAGTADNVIPDSAVLRGTVRTLRPQTRDFIEKRLGELVQSIAAAHGTEASLDYKRGYPSVVNDGSVTELAAAAAIGTVGGDNVELQRPPSMGAEDFAYMAQQVPASFVRIGTAKPGETPVPLHNSRYDFNDAALAVGASLWVRVAEAALARE